VKGSGLVAGSPAMNRQIEPLGSGSIPLGATNNDSLRNERASVVGGI
jgi:hypothetical protein